MRNVLKTFMFLVALEGCGGPDADTYFTSAQMELSFGQPSSSATSVQIVGQRVSTVDNTTPMAAQSRYRCDNSINTCVNFSGQDVATLQGMCASNATPNGRWNFTYSLYSGSNCTGTQVNGASSVPLQCFDSDDIVTRQNANSTKGKWLASLGANSDAVMCLVGKLAVTTQPTQVAERAVMAPGVTVQITDAFGTAKSVSNTLISLSISSGPGAFTASSTTQVTTDATGKAVFSNLAFTAAGTYVLSASSSGLLSTTTQSFTVTPAYLQYASTTLPVSRTNNGSISVTYPSGTQANDLLFLIQTNGVDRNFTTPTGWTLLADERSSSGGKFRFTVWWKNAGTETSVTLTVQTDSNGSTAWVVRYNRPGSTPLAATLATALTRQSNPGATILLTPSPDVTTNLSAATVISFVAIRANNALSLSTPRGFVFRDWETFDPKTATGFAFADITAATSGTTPASPTWSQSGSAVAWTWATTAFR